MNKLNESLLDTIESIDDLCYDSEMNVLCEMYNELNKLNMIAHYSDNEEAVQTFMESDTSSSGDKKKSKNFFRKILDFIKKVLKAIGKAIKKAWNFITGKKDKELKDVEKTPAQILDGLSKSNEEPLRPEPSAAPTNNEPINGPAPESTHNPTEAQNAEPTPESNVQPEQQPAQSQLPMKSKVSAKPTEPKGYQSPYIDENGLARKSFLNDDAYLVDTKKVASFYNVYRSSENNVWIFHYNKGFKTAEIKGMGPGDDSRSLVRSPYIAAYFHDFRGEFIKMVDFAIDMFKKFETKKELSKQESKELARGLDKMIKALDAFDAKLDFRHLSGGDIKFSPTILEPIEDTIKELTNKIPDLDRAVEVVSTANQKGDHLIDVAKIEVFLNKISSMLFSVQMSLNTIWQAFALRFEVPLNQRDTLDLSGIDNFVHELIEAKYPEKYIAKLVYDAAEIRFKDGSHGEAKMGQSRGCLIPALSHDVIKFALCNRAKVDFKNEFHVYNTFRKLGEDSLLCPIVSLYPKQCVMVEKKVEILSAKYPNTKFDNLPENVKKAFKDLEKNLHDVCEKHRLHMRFEDLHNGNVGFYNNKMVACDFGYMELEVH